MTERIITNNDYGQLSARLGVVRRAWKRAAMLSGLAIVVTESIGIFTALLFLDWLYQPLPVVRVGVAIAALVVVGYLFVRHVVRPLLRAIPDEQIALYIEENRTELDGILITATEFGRKRDQIAGNQLVLIDAVVHEAAARCARTQVSQIGDFSRLRKYGLGAVVGIGLYALLSFLFPGTFTHHLGRVLQPWQATPEDLTRNAAIVAQEQPLQFTFSRGDTSLPRGSSFDFEVTLSKAKPVDQPVVMYFRPKTAGAAWQKLAMTEIEKLNGFQGSLPDVSEDLEFYVACGDAKSETHQLTVYDPLVVQTLEMATHYPDYLKLSDRIEKPSTGDVAAVIGSTATLKIVASTPLKSGQIKWNDGQTQPVTINAQGTGTVSFEVKEDAVYDYTLTDVNGQQAVSPASLSVHAIPDLPPTVTVKSPMSPVLTHPLGEVNFVVEADDDFGVAGIDLVYSRLDPQGVPKETRIVLKPVAEASASPHAVTASYRLMLEDIQPPMADNETISYHLEARDDKGQMAVSNLGFVAIDYFEHWATYSPPDTGADDDDNAADLMAVVAMIWELNNDKPHLKADELKKQTQDTIAKMVDAQGNMLNFVTAHDLKLMPKLAQVTKPIAEHAKKAHDALVAGDTAKATAEISVAAALFTGYGINQDSSLETAGQNNDMGSHYKPPALTMLEQARLDALAAADKDKTTEEQDQAQSKAMADAAKQVADLVAKQNELVNKAQALPNGEQPTGAPNAGQQPGAQPPGDAKTPATPSPASQKLAADLAAAQHDVAEQTRAAAAQAQAHATDAHAATKLQAAANKTADAAKLMEEAARDFAAGKTGEAQAKAGEAKSTLTEAGNTLQNTDRDQLATDIGNAETSVAMLLDKQKDLADQTTKLATDINGKSPDQRQQRDLQKQAYQQTQLGAQVEALNNKLNDLNQQAAQVGEAEAIRALNDAQHALKRGQPQAKMDGAVVDLNNGNAADAAGEQTKAGDTLQTVVEKLQAGSDALAVSRDAQLNRANRIAQNAKKGLDNLANKTADAQKGTQPESDNQDAARKVSNQLGQLKSALDNRQLLPQDQVDQLKQMTMSQTDLENKLVSDPKFLHDATDLVSQIGNKIEAEMEAKTEASKLFSSQREECPPSYRQLVNKYFEALSKASPGAAVQPAQP